MTIESIDSKLANASGLLLEDLSDFQLCPYEVSIISDFIYDLPPETTTQDSLYQCGVVSESHEALERSIAFLSRLHIQAICKIHPKDEIAIGIKPILKGSFSYFTCCLGHSKDKEVLLTRIGATGTDILLDFLVD
jgi:hypothetical protein